MQKIFTAAMGRTGTNNLAVLFNKFGRNCISEHEPPALLLQQLQDQPFFDRHPGLRPKEKLAQVGRDLQRRYIVTDEMLGRGRALDWYDSGDKEKLSRLVHWRLRRIERFSKRGYKHYIESSQFFLRTYCYQVYGAMPGVGTIKLLRDPLETARSSANRKKDLFQNNLPPDCGSNLFRLEEWQDLTPFQHYVHTWIETELRWEAFLKATNIERCFVIQTRDLSNSERLSEMFDYFGIEHKPFIDLRPTNTNTEMYLPGTQVTRRDNEDYLRVVDKLPEPLRDQIPQLEDFLPHRDASSGSFVLRLGEKHNSRPVMGSSQLGRIIADFPITAIDIGARGGIIRDLLPIAGVVDAVGFEPDVEECNRLKEASAQTQGPWRSEQYVPTAVSGDSERRTLYLTRHRGTSSMMEPIPGFGERYSRPDYYFVEGSVEVDTITLDQAVLAHDLDSPVYLKLDIEGMEKEVIEAAPLTMAKLLAVRTEAVFLQPRKGQPSFHEIDGSLRNFGFIPMGFEEIHHWRRLSQVKPPETISGPIPYSRGQLAHCDMLYLRDFELMPEDTEADVSRLIQTAFIALCYDYVDHALAILARPAVASLLVGTYGVDIEREISVASYDLLARHRRGRRRKSWLGFRGATSRRLRAT